MEEAKRRMGYCEGEDWIDMSRKRVTDVKGNSRVTFPSGPKSLEMESRLEVLRVEAMEVFRKYVREKCDSRGRQESNLTPAQRRGMKSLKKRVENGEIVVVPTDKTGI